MFLAVRRLLVSSSKCRYDAELTHLSALVESREVGQKVVVYDLY